MSTNTKGKVLAVVGAREFPDLPAVADWVKKNAHRFDQLVTGDAAGVDSTAAKAWEEATGRKPKIYRANWERYKNAAGMLRNVSIIDAATFVVVFWAPDYKRDLDHSRGSMDDIGLAVASGKPMNVYYRP